MRQIKRIGFKNEADRLQYMKWIRTQLGRGEGIKKLLIYLKDNEEYQQYEKCAVIKHVIDIHNFLANDNLPTHINEYYEQRKSANSAQRA